MSINFQTRKEPNVASGIFISGSILKNEGDTTLDINDLGGGEIAISVDGGDEFVFEVSDADSVISAIREMADRVKKRSGVPDKVKADIQTKGGGRK